MNSPAAGKRLATLQQELLREVVVVGANLADVVVHEFCDVFHVGDASVAYTGCQ